MASPRITIVKHPMALEQLTLARDRRSDQVIFRKAIFRLGRMLAYEFLRTLETKEVLVETPLEKSRGKKIKGNDKIVIVMILRASIPFVEGMYKMLPMARTGIISAWRGEPPDCSIEGSYAKIPTIHEDDIAIIADPMLATGHT
ncbi:MAG: uracil phosphoribosyltransferase, partial [Thaumarchaeota archaeon]